MLKLYDQLAQIADSDAPVLIVGESGTGKELVAKALHRRSRRGEAVRCRELQRLAGYAAGSELFGHVKGSFYRRSSRSSRAVSQAEGGTLFLDESARCRSRCNRNFAPRAENRVRPVGGEGDRGADAHCWPLRIATWKRPEEGRFRNDLYFRIDVIQINLPPLRARGTDALLLAQHFIEVCAARRQVLGLSEGVGEKLWLTWPGNVRLAERNRTGGRSHAFRPTHAR